MGARGIAPGASACITRNSPAGGPQTQPWPTSAQPVGRPAPDYFPKNLLRRDPFPPCGPSLVFPKTRRYAMSDESEKKNKQLKVKPGKQDALLGLLKQN